MPDMQRSGAGKDFRPFCSKRCADIDLHRWLGEGYAIPAYEPPDDWSAEDMLSEETTSRRAINRAVDRLLTGLALTSMEIIGGVSSCD